MGVDITPPEPFAIQTDNGNDPTNPQPTLKFKAYDALSGINHYEIKIGKDQIYNVPTGEIADGSYRMPICSPGIYSIIIRAVDQAGNYSIAMEDLEIAPIETPVITEYPQKLYPGNPLVVKGTSTVCDRVMLSVKDERKDVLTTDAKCENGAFSVILGKTLEKGIYSIWVKAIDSRGAESNPTQPIKVIVSLPIFITIGSLVIDYLNVIISLFALILLMAMAWLYGLKKVRDLKASIKKETKEAETALAKGFNILRSEMTKQVARLDEKKGLSSKENALNESLKQALNQAESAIGKEIQDIKKDL